jgi:hypothetical protein
MTLVLVQDVPLYGNNAIIAKASAKRTFTVQNDKRCAIYRQIAKCTFTVQNALYHPDGKMYVLMYC